MTNNAKPDKPAPAAMESYSVVVADDDRSIADLIAMNLRRLGHQVIGIARNGKEAVELTIKKSPDIVIMDINMPVMNGLEASREILRHRLTPILLSTAVSDSKAVRGAVDLNVISFLVKPFSPAQLMVAVQLAVEQCRRLVDPVSIPADGAAAAAPTER